MLAADKIGIAEDGADVCIVHFVSQAQAALDGRRQLGSIAVLALRVVGHFVLDYAYLGYPVVSVVLVILVVIYLQFVLECLGVRSRN